MPRIGQSSNGACGEWLTARRGGAAGMPAVHVKSGWKMSEGADAVREGEGCSLIMGHVTHRAVFQLSTGEVSSTRDQRCCHACSVSSNVYCGGKELLCNLVVKGCVGHALAYMWWAQED